MTTPETESKNIKKESTKSDDLLQRIIDLLPIRIFWKDKNLTFLGCNKIFAKDAGKNDPKDIIGKDDFQMNWKDQAKLYQLDDQKVINSGQPKLNFEESQTTPQGKLNWVRTSKVPLTDPQGKIIGILGIYEDITDKKKDDEIIKTKFEEIERMNNLMVGRELKMIELKKEIEELKKKIPSSP
jgi:PAS domain S-box-containing protein